MAMRICVVSPPIFPIPPLKYAGIERTCYYVSLGLSELGHTVTLMAKEGSYTPPNGRLVVYTDEHDSPKYSDILETESPQDVYIDITHDHLLSVHRPNLKVLNNLQVVSLMGDGKNLVLISYGQWRERFQFVKDAEVIYQPISLSECFPYYGERDNYLLYMGQRVHYKRIEWAMELAIRTNTPLKTYSPGWGEPEYHKMLYEMRDAHPDLIEINCDIGGDEKIYTIQHAKALVHPVGADGWVEAGGIIVLESLACGTPVIGAPNGCLLEYIQPEKNGFICGSVDEMVDALEKVPTIRPEDCRESALKYDYRLAARQWERLCQRVASGEQWNV